MLGCLPPVDSIPRAARMAQNWRFSRYAPDNFREAVRFHLMIARDKAARLPDLDPAEIEAAWRRIEPLIEEVISDWYPLAPLVETLPDPPDLLRTIAKIVATAMDFAAFCGAAASVQQRNKVRRTGRAGPGRTAQAE